MKNHFFANRLIYSTHVGASSLIRRSQYRLPTEKLIIEIEKVVISQKIIKRGLKKDMTDFLQTPNKLFGKKKDKSTKAREKQVEKNLLKRTILCSFNYRNKKKSSVSIQTTIKSNQKLEY